MSEILPQLRKRFPAQQETCPVMGSPAYISGGNYPFKHRSYMSEDQTGIKNQGMKYTSNKEKQKLSLDLSIATINPYTS